MRKPTSRGRVLVSAGVATGLCLTATAMLSSPTQAAMGTCDTAYPVASVTQGQAVTGLTVTSGRTPTGFTGQVLGVLTDGIEPGVDMIMMRLTSTEIDRVGGIWEGMSGSPVYAADGRLIGAVAYGLAYGTTPVAGITPYEDMQQYAGTPAPTKVHIPDAAARTVARAAGLSTDQANQGFTELRVPIAVAGIGPRALARDTGRPYLSKNAYAAGTSTAAASPTAADMIAGGNLVATMSTGDAAAGGVGTITSVCNGTVIGFGHPMNFVGRTTYGMAGADAVYVQEDPLGVPFKVANIGDLLGTISQDRMTGISGLLGATPPSLPISSTVTYGTRTRTGTSNVQLPISAAQTANYELISNHQAVMDAYQAGTEKQSWTVTGHTTAGPFTFTGGNRYADAADITFASVWDLPDLVWLLSNISGVTIDSVNVTSLVHDGFSTWKIAGALQRRQGTWHVVDKTHPAEVVAGRTLVMKAMLSGPAGTHGRRFSVHIPQSAAGTRSRLLLSSAEQYPFEQSMPNSVAGVRRLVDGMVRNDQIQVDLSLLTKGGVNDLSSTTSPLGRVVTGHKAFKVKVS
jgi:hypothetical protein